MQAGSKKCNSDKIERELHGLCEKHSIILVLYKSNMVYYLLYHYRYSRPETQAQKILLGRTKNVQDGRAVYWLNGNRLNSLWRL